MISVRRSSPNLGDDLGQFFADDLAPSLRVGQNRIEFSDLGFEFRCLVDDLLALQSGQTAKLHVEDGPGLQLIDLEQVDEPVAGILNGG